MTYEEDGGPTLWISLEERPRLRVGFQEEVGEGRVKVWMEHWEGVGRKGRMRGKTTRKTGPIR